MKTPPQLQINVIPVLFFLKTERIYLSNAQVGTITKISAYTFLLNNNARFSPNDTIKWNQGYPFPSKLHFKSTDPELLDDQETINTLIEQVHQFSRLYWKSVTQQSVPVTVLYPKLAAQHMTHFNINQLPPHSQNSLWFL